MPETILVLAGAVYKFVEVVKPMIRSLVIDRFKASEDVYSAVVQAFSMLVGFLMAAINNVNLVSIVAPSVPTWMGFLATGFVIALGSDILNALIDLVYGWQRPKAA